MPHPLPAPAAVPPIVPAPRIASNVESDAAVADTRRRLSDDRGAPETGGNGAVDEGRFQPGQTILGHYTVVRQLGKGGMGTVYLARDDVSGQEVAVKVLPAQLARERDIRERFILEARALASMDHPNIVPLITFAQEGEDRFLVMKYVAGEPLDARIRRLGVLPPQHARKVLRAMLSALGYAHARGVIHRDVKPSNVLIEGDLDGEHRVFLVDFGIAKKEEGGKRLTQTGMLMGTPQYMSPEQISGQPVDRRSDIYAAGLVLFEMLAGRPPFDGQKTFQVLRAHVEQPVPDVREVRGSPLPEDLVALTYLLLRKDPSERPSDAQEAIGLLDGTGSFPVLKDEKPPPPHAPATLTPATTMMARPLSLSSPISDSPPTGSVSGDLDDPSMEELAAVRPRRAGLIAATLLVVAGAAAAAVLQPWKTHVVETASDAGGDATDAPPGDTASATASTTRAMLLAKARVALEKKEWDDARVFVDTVLETDPRNLKALSLRVDVLTGGGAPDDARKTLDKLKAALAAPGAEPDDEVAKHVVEQEAALSGARADEPEKDASSTTKPRPPRKPRGAPRPSELSKAAFLEITSRSTKKIQLCYEEIVQSKDAKAAGEVTLKVTVGPSGTVSDVSVRAPKPFDNADFKSCLSAQARSWKFKPFQGEPDTFLHKFYFAPG